MFGEKSLVLSHSVSWKEIETHSAGMLKELFIHRSEVRVKNPRGILKAFRDYNSRKLFPPSGPKKSVEEKNSVIKSMSELKDWESQKNKSAAGTMK